MNVVKGTLDPMRPGNTGKTRISKCNYSLMQANPDDLLGVHPRLLRRDHIEHQKIGDEMRGSRSIAGTFDGSYGLLKAVGLAAVGSQVGTVVDDIFGHHLTEGGVVLTVDQPCGLVSGLGKGFDC